MVQPPADPLVGMVLDSRYRIVDLIGRGGMGAVYRVEHVKMGKIMAVKILHGELSSNQDLARRFRQEAETVSQLTHSNTVSVFDFGSFGGMTYLVMEYIDGRDLAEVLAADGPLHFIRASRILVQVCSALKEAHSKGIVHRDLKPENILICHQDDQDDFVKVLDFGLAKLRDSYRTKITKAGSLVGTPYYMAPEHIRSETVDQRSDVYAMGAVLHKLITGEPPFTANTPMAICTKHLTQAPVPPSEAYPDLQIPTAADRIVLTAMQKEPAKRYQSAEEMRGALADAIEEAYPGSAYRRFSSSDVPPPSIAPPAQSPIKKKRGSWRLGKRQVDPSGDWKAGDLVTTQVESEGVAPPKPDTPPADFEDSRSKSTTIGSREVAIGTRSDFLAYERTLRRKRASMWIASGVLLAMAVAAILYFILQAGTQRPDPTAETEPNDAPVQADPLTAGVALSATLAPNGQVKDVDWYLLRGQAQGTWALGAQATASADLDIALHLVDSSAKAPLATVDNTRTGGTESLGPVAVATPFVYLAVQRSPNSDTPSGDRLALPYRVVYQTYEPNGIEVEPNNTPADARPIVVGQALTGSLDTADVSDWYQVPAGTPVRTVQASSAPGLDIELTLILGAEGREMTVNNLGPGQGEGVQIPQGHGPVRIGVGPKVPLRPGGTGQYQLLVR